MASAPRLRTHGQSNFFADNRRRPVTLSRLALTRDKIYKTVSRQLHGVVPCWVCGEHVSHDSASLEHIKPLSERGSSHLDNLAISHARCNHQRHAKTTP
jgi:5-methylcytosine-specific restriction endonuclease McrA